MAYDKPEHQTWVARFTGGKCRALEDPFLIRRATCFSFLARSWSLRLIRASRLPPDPQSWIARKDRGPSERSAGPTIATPRAGSPLGSTDVCVPTAGYWAYGTTQRRAGSVLRGGHHAL